MMTIDRRVTRRHTRHMLLSEGMLDGDGSMDIGPCAVGVRGEYLDEGSGDGSGGDIEKIVQCIVYLRDTVM
jgi:hypothetical protein